MDDLIAFLHARLDEDEQAIPRSRSVRDVWRQGDDADHDWKVSPSEVVSTRPDGSAVEVQATTYGAIGPDVAVHIARHHPTRVLAEVDAKRQIIELAEEANGVDMQVDGDRRIGSRDEVSEPYVGDQILRHLARPYDHHPDYREEWKP